jgi:hypothetical protein
MTDLPALDVAIGLVFLYFLLALICSTINELVSTAIGLRARFLQAGILNLFSGHSETTDEAKATAMSFYSHPLVQGLIRPGHGPDPTVDPTATTRWFKKSPYPSYLPSRTFVAAITDLAREAEGKLKKIDPNRADVASAQVENASERLKASLAAIPNKRLSEAMLALYRSADEDVEGFKHAAEQWFDDSMERVSGWYRRKVQLLLAIFAVLVVGVLNADTLTTAKVLWRDDATRASVVARAEAATTDKDKINEAIKDLDVPLGWEFSFGDGSTQAPNDLLAWVAKVIGLLLTVGAVMLGAPFWFDLLSKVTRVRGTGAPPPASDAVRTGDADQSRAGSKARTTTTS